MSLPSCFMSLQRCDHKPFSALASLRYVLCLSRPRQDSRRSSFLFLLPVSRRCALRSSSIVKRGRKVWSKQRDVRRLICPRNATCIIAIDQLCNLGWKWASFSHVAADSRRRHGQEAAAEAVRCPGCSLWFGLMELGSHPTWTCREQIAKTWTPIDI